METEDTGIRMWCRKRCEGSQQLTAESQWQETDVPPPVGEGD
jgi:hypothetical protein